MLEEKRVDEHKAFVSGVNYAGLRFLSRAVQNHFDCFGTIALSPPKMILISPVCKLTTWLFRGPMRTDWAGNEMKTGGKSKKENTTTRQAKLTFNLY